MAHPLPHQPEQGPPPAAPSFTPPIPWLAAGMDEEEAALTMGLGLLMREAANVEYILHGLVVHLAGEPRAWAYKATTSVSTYIKECTKRLQAMGEDAPIPSAARDSLLFDLDLCEKHFKERNRYAHGSWIYDDEEQSWLTLKGDHDSDWPEIMHVGSERLWELAAEFNRLCQKLVSWDAAFFGEVRQTDDGPPQPVSVKR